MSSNPASDLGIRGNTLIVGLGKTGFSCARFLRSRGLTTMITDSRPNPPLLSRLREELPEVPVSLGSFSSAALNACDQLIVSPGVALQDPFIIAAQRQGIPVMGDVELFARCANAPVVGITGSNGKSTVTALVGAMAEQAGLDVRVGGNIGTPALDLLTAEAPDFYVLELSSYQLETTHSLNSAAVVILNITPDHLDRYSSLDAYRTAKARIYQDASIVIFNRDEHELKKMVPDGRKTTSFGIHTPPADGYGVVENKGRPFLAKGDCPLLPISELLMLGRHNILNALAALAIGDAIGLPVTDMVSVLQTFSGLPHRMQWVAEKKGIDWYNDSKATNVGATLAALNGLDRRVVLIAGGIGKGADFSPLKSALADQARAVVLLGRDAARE